jgi:uncharacterized protein YegP (UPF0339 family)
MHWEIVTVPAGFRVRLVASNGQEIMRAMTIYNDKRDAESAIRLARQTETIVRREEDNG